MSGENTFDLPLFPLNVVLYPGMLLPLHIFEPRYRAMINDTMHGTQSFGVALIAAGKQEEDTFVIPKPIGTIARIAQLHHLDPEHINLWVIGHEKIEIVTYAPCDDEYLVGQVRIVHDSTEDEQLYVPQLDSMREKFKMYIELKLRLNNRDPHSVEYEFSGEPTPFSFQIASLLDISLAEKQALLEIEVVSERLSRESDILTREIDHLRELMKSHVTPQTQSLPWGGEVSLN